MFSFERRSRTVVILLVLLTLVIATTVLARERATDDWAPMYHVTTVADIEDQHNSSLMQPTPSVPGLELLATVLAVGAVALAMKRRQ